MAESVPLTLWFDDEEAGGAASWSDKTVAGAIPRQGDWVWDRDNVHYVVEQVGWTFVQPGSTNARSRDWRPHVRVHVRRAIRCDVDESCTRLAVDVFGGEIWYCEEHEFQAPAAYEAWRASPERERRARS